MTLGGIFVPDELFNPVLVSGLAIQHDDASLKRHLLKIQVILSNL